MRKYILSHDSLSAERKEMVIKYVADGSGTHDMIETAISRLKSAAGL